LALPSEYGLTQRVDHQTCPHMIGDRMSQDAARMLAILSAQGCSINAIVDEAAASRTTLNRNRAKFKDFIRDERDKLADETAVGLLAMNVEAMAGLRELLASKNDAVRFGA
jgi:hypothetical protein